MQQESQFNNSIVWKFTFENERWKFIPMFLSKGVLEPGKPNEHGRLYKDNSGYLSPPDSEKKAPVSGQYSSSAEPRKLSGKIQNHTPAPEEMEYEKLNDVIKLLDRLIQQALTATELYANATESLITLYVGHESYNESRNLESAHERIPNLLVLSQGVNEETIFSHLQYEENMLTDAIQLSKFRKSVLKKQDQTKFHKTKLLEGCMGKSAIKIEQGRIHKARRLNGSLQGKTRLFDTCDGNTSVQGEAERLRFAINRMNWEYPVLLAKIREYAAYVKREQEVFDAEVVANYINESPMSLSSSDSEESSEEET